MLHGETRIELLNVKTGKTERFIDHNMFTNALDSVFNRAPYGFNNGLMGILKESSATRLVPTFSEAIGGLLLFPQTIEEDVETIYAPASNKPTGIASNDAYSDSDTRRGSFNSVESGATSNGYRFVWDFTTSQANGQIACACLTSAKGGAGYLDSGNPFLHDRYYINNTDGYYLGYQRRFDNLTSANHKGFYCDSTGIYFVRNDRKTVERYIGSQSVLDLANDYLTVEECFTADTIGFVCGDDENIYVVRPTAGSDSTSKLVYIDAYAKNSWTKTTTSISVAAPLMATASGYYSIAKVGNYIYLPSYDKTKLYKVDITNSADVTEIDVGTVDISYCNFGDMVASINKFIEADDTVHSNTCGQSIIGKVGAWAIVDGDNISKNYHYIGASPFMPYLATINNLSSVVTKTADKTMKVTYTVTNG